MYCRESNTLSVKERLICGMSDPVCMTNSSETHTANPGYVDKMLLPDPSPSDDEERVERWLDGHPDFVHNYFLRKAKRYTVDEWLVLHSVYPLQQEPSISLTAGQLEASSSASLSNSGANTPVRKISAQEFDRGSVLNPMVSTVGGTPTFLGPVSPSGQPSTTLTGGVASAPKLSIRRRSRSELQALDEKELMYELVKDTAEELDVAVLCFKILQNVSVLLNADCCSLFLVQYNYSGEKILVSKLFDVNSRSTFEECLKQMEEINIPWGTGIIGHVAKTGESLNIPDAYQDPRFNSEVDLKTGYKTHSILSMAIKDQNGEVIGVAQTVNKFGGKDEPFDEKDEKVFASYLAFCGIGLKNAQQYEKSLLENRRNQVLLDLVRVIFEEQHTVAILIKKIMMHTQSLLKCEVCQVLLVKENSKGIFSEVFELHADDIDNENIDNKEGSFTEARFPINIGITGHVAATGEILNIPDAHADERFDPFSEQHGFKVRSILCMPIQNACGQTIGVSQLINKLDRTPFNKNDENIFEAFAIFCGIGIHNTHMYETAMNAIARQRVSLEMLSYHATASVKEALQLKKKSVASAAELNLLDFHFDSFTLDDDQTLRACIRMFIDLDFMETFHISQDVLCRWLLSVKKNYRDVTYHNWRHAFNVSQTMFCMMKTGGMNRLFTPCEQISLLVASLCHDLDHRGQNNQFQIKTMSPLAQLYSTSTLEHHHFDQCIMILNTKGNDIFGNLSEEEYRNVIQILEACILATDLALYFTNRTKFFDLVNTGSNWEPDENRELLRAMMMTACDVAAITKPWEVQTKIAKLVASEFFEQGDIEKEQLNLTPSRMMDRDRKDELPDMQINFINSICLPVYEAMSQISVNLMPLQDGCIENRRKWEELAEANKSTKENGEEEKD